MPGWKFQGGNKEKKNKNKQCFNIFPTTKTALNPRYDHNADMGLNPRHPISAG